MWWGVLFYKQNNLKIYPEDVWFLVFQQSARDLLWFYISLPTDIQAESIPLILGGGDVLMVYITLVCLIE